MGNAAEAALAGGRRRMTEIQNLLSDVTLTKEDFNRCNWQAVVESSQKKDCQNYFSHFSKCANEAEATGRTICQKVFAVLSVVSLPILSSRTKDAPFTLSNGIDTLSDDLLSVLRELVPEISDAEFRARVADVIWVRKRDHEMAECAVRSYLASSSVLQQDGQGISIADRLQRAMRISISLNNKMLIGSVTRHIESFLTRCNDRRFEPAPLWLMRSVFENRKALRQHQQLGGSEYAACAQKAAVRAEIDKKLILAEQYWSVNASWHEVEENDEQVRKARIRSAETFIRMSNDHVKKTEPSYLAAHALLSQAIEAFREIPGAQDRVEELHKRLLDYGTKAIAEMRVFSAEQEIDREILQRAKLLVKRKTVYEALSSLAFAVVPPSVSDLRKAALNAIELHPLHFLFETKSFNSSGKVIAHIPAELIGDAQREATIRAKMFENARLIRFYRVASTIEPARSQIALEHEIRLDDLYPIVRHNIFVPQGREDIFAKALYSGLTGDFLASTHLLVPQLENSLRSLIVRQGGITSKLDANGIQQEHNLNTLLCGAYASLLETILGEDFTFELRGFLVEEYGSNVRNNLAHGLFDSGWFISLEPVYLWWLGLHLCFRPLQNV
jgi:hypothetical protein